MEKYEYNKILISYRGKVLNPAVGRTDLNSELYKGLERIMKPYVKRDCNNKISLAKPLDEDEFARFYPTMATRIISELYIIFQINSDKKILRLSHLKKMIERHEKGDESSNIGKKCIGSMKDYLVKKGIKVN